MQRRPRPNAPRVSHRVAKRSAPPHHDDAAPPPPTVVVPTPRAAPSTPVVNTGISDARIVVGNAKDSGRCADTAAAVAAVEQGVHLVMQFFRVRMPANPRGEKERQAEYDEALQRNLGNPHVRAVHVLLENDSDDLVALRAATAGVAADAEDKVVTHLLGKRMLYRDAFQYANDHLTGRIVVVLNSDISIGSDLSLVWGAARALLSDAATKRMFALTRHEWHACASMSTTNPEEYVAGDVAAGCGCPQLASDKDFIDMHDSFWFTAPVPSSFVASVDHRQNVWGAEHRVICEALHSGYTVSNPCRSIVTFHHHESDVRPWLKEEGGRDHIAKSRDHPRLRATTLRDVL